MKHTIGLTKNGHSVYVDLIGSRAAKHISSQPQLLVLLKEALHQLSPTNEHASFECDMGRSIGYDLTVSFSEKDAVFYAQLMKSDVFTPFTKSVAPLRTQILSLAIQKTADNEYELVDAWTGTMVPPLPGSDDETDESLAYWSTHAVVFTDQAIQSRTITKTSPYAEVVL